MGLAELTHKLYVCGMHRFLNVCSAAKLIPVPATEELLCHFAAFLANDDLHHRSIKSYLPGVRHLQISEGHGGPFTASLQHLHYYVMRGIKRAEGLVGVIKKEHHLITTAILCKIKEVWDPMAQNTDVVMLYEAYCLAFFGFMRIGELTVPHDNVYNVSSHLSWGDITVDDPARPSATGSGSQGCLTSSQSGVRPLLRA